jgi:hypothetical protein
MRQDGRIMKILEKTFAYSFTWNTADMGEQGLLNWEGSFHKAF